MAAALDGIFGPERYAVFQRPIECRPVHQAIARDVTERVVIAREQL